MRTEDVVRRTIEELVERWNLHIDDINSLVGDVMLEIEQAPLPSENTLSKFRRTDPSTSRQAAFDHLPRSGSQRAKVLDCLVRTHERFPGRALTYFPIAYQTGISGVWKRLSELKQGGWIEVAGQQKIPNTGTLADAYVITEKTKALVRQRGRLF